MDFIHIELADDAIELTDAIIELTDALIESTDGKERWYTVSVDENIIKASLQALMDSIEFRLLKK